MRTVILDANAVLRFLTNDLPSQASRIEKRFKQADQGKITFRIFPITTVEILFHLEKWYKFAKNEAVDKMLILFSPKWMEADDKEVILEALRVYREKKIDFVDLLLWSFAKRDGQKILSFDKDFRKLKPDLGLSP